MLRRPAAFLDRDGTINVRAPEHDYIREPRDFRWIPGALEGMVVLARAGLPLVVVSNQRGVSRGLVSPSALEAIERIVQDGLAAHQCSVEAFRYCTHRLEEECRCRKPRPGMLLDAAQELGIDLPRSWMIGDTPEDVEAGRAAGCRTIRLTPTPVASEPTATSLLDAARIVVRELDG